VLRTSYGSSGGGNYVSNYVYLVYATAAISEYLVGLFVGKECKPTHAMVEATEQVAAHIKVLCRGASLSSPHSCASPSQMLHPADVVNVCRLCLSFLAVCA
jgi:hypothetical protein